MFDGRTSHFKFHNGFKGVKHHLTGSDILNHTVLLIIVSYIAACNETITAVLGSHVLIIFTLNIRPVPHVWNRLCRWVSSVYYNNNTHFCALSIAKC